MDITRVSHHLALHTITLYSYPPPSRSSVSLHLPAQITGLGPRRLVQSSRNPVREQMIACDYSLTISSGLIWPGLAKVTLSTLESLTGESRSEKKLNREALTRFLHLDIASRLRRSFHRKVQFWEARSMRMKRFFPDT